MSPGVQRTLRGYAGFALDVGERSNETRKRPSPEGSPSKKQWDKEAREKALQLFPVKTEVQRPFVDGTGRKRVFEGRVYNFQDGYWRVECTDGDREDMSRRDPAKWTTNGRQN